MDVFLAKIYSRSRENVTVFFVENNKIILLMRARRASEQYPIQFGKQYILVFFIQIYRMCDFKYV